MYKFVGYGLTRMQVRDIAELKKNFRVLEIKHYNKYFDIIDNMFIIDKELSMEIIEGMVYNLYIDRELLESIPYPLVIGYKERRLE